MKVVKEEVVGNRVMTCIEAQLDTVQIEQKVRQTVQRNVKTAKPIMSNAGVQILSAEINNVNIDVIYKLLVNTPNNIELFQNPRVFTIFWTLYDDYGIPINGGSGFLQNAIDCTVGEIRRDSIFTYFNIKSGNTISWNLGSPPKN
jgi:hypothetical protein